MARRAFFSFHFARDSFRAGIVRNSGLVAGVDEAGFYDSADWESVMRKDPARIKKWIDDQLNGTSVTAVLIGNETHNRPWVRYELEASKARGNGILGVRIHMLTCARTRTTDHPGQCPLTRTFGSHRYRTYDYVADNGFANLGRWIELAAREAE